jgi:hypothetical protein
MSQDDSKHEKQQAHTQVGPRSQAGFRSEPSASSLEGAGRVTPNSTTSTEMDPSKQTPSVSRTNSAGKRETTATAKNTTPLQRHGLQKVGSGSLQPVHLNEVPGNSATRMQSEGTRDEQEEETEVSLEPYTNIPEVRFLSGFRVHACVCGCSK